MKRGNTTLKKNEDNNMFPQTNTNILACRIISPSHLGANGKCQVLPATTSQPLLNELYSNCFLHLPPSQPYLSTFSGSAALHRTVTQFQHQNSKPASVRTQTASQIQILLRQLLQYSQLGFHSDPRQQIKKVDIKSKRPPSKPGSRK